MNKRTTLLGEANRAKTHCPKGHEYTLENTLLPSRGGRRCRECRRIGGRKDWVFPKELPLDLVEKMPARFWNSIQIGPPGIHSQTNEDLGPCWIWTKNIIGGYGKSCHPDRPCLSRLVHRIVWVLAKGQIADGLELDHLCRVRSCCNPEHLEPVTPIVNVERGKCGDHQRNKTHCANGHPYNARNTYFYEKKNERHCRVCAKMNARKRSKQQK